MTAAPPRRKPAPKPPRPRPASAGPTASAARAISKIAPARAAAFAILAQVGQGTAHSDELLHSGKSIAALSLEDRNLATALVMGVLRWQIALDARLAKLLARPDQRLAEPVALALRIGAFQLVHMDRIPAHAALSESVELCRAAGHPHAAGMVNAILRKLATEAASQGEGSARSQRSVPLHESTAAFAERLANPRWLVERWVAAYGREAALAICEYDQREPVHGELFNPPAEASPAATEPLAEAAPQMDDGSRLVAELAAAALPPTPPHAHARAPRVWDCCAAPGGKTLLVAQRLQTADILATDIGAKRLAQTAARLRRAYAQRVECLVADAAAPAAIDGLFDLILCDVPCSGTGTLARNPEIRLRLHAEDLARQAERQRAILTGAVSRLAPGGRLVYSTCSLEPEENERVVESVADSVASSASLRRLPIGPFIAQLASTGILPQEAAAHLTHSAIRTGALRTLPGVHPCDGFYAAVLERV